MSGNGFSGFQEFEDTRDDASALLFAIQAQLAKLSTCTVVRVAAVHPAENPLDGGTVDVQPLVKMIDGANNTYPHGLLYSLPYLRLQSGTSAVIMDPVIGDIGIALFADRDITAVKATKEVAPPGSRRWFDMSDGMYLPALGSLNVTPAQYVKFLPDNAGVEIITPGAVTVNCEKTATINCKDAVVHGSHSYSWDVDGYGERTTFSGGSSFQVDSYKDGAVVNTTEHGWTPPKLPDPT